MATGIISIAAHNLGMAVIADILFLISRAAYFILAVLFVTRFFVLPTNLVKGVSGTEGGPPLLTLVAGTCVLGSAYANIGENMAAGFILLIVGMFLWIVVGYFFFTTVIIRASKPPFENTPDGAWLLFVVATQSVSILGTTVSPLVPSLEGIFLLAMLSVFFLGVMFYIVLIAAIMYRLFFFSFTPERFTPLYWIAMGAAAITTLAGLTLMAAGERWALLAEIRPFLMGLSLFFWAFTNWWIPLLIILTAWKHIFRRLSPAYDVEYWGMVFPLGMYTFCTYQVAKTAGLEFLIPVSGFFIYIALAAWAVTFTSLVRRLLQVIIVRKLHQ